MNLSEESLRPLTHAVIGAAIEVHKVLGPGLLESAYQECLCHELELRGISFEQQVYLPLDYKRLRIGSGFRVDLLVDGRLVVELKAVTDLTDLDRAQLLTYLRLLNLPLGLIINFNVPLLSNGIIRMANGLRGASFQPDLSDVDLQA